MTINELIKDKFEGKRLISINGRKIDKLIESIETGAQWDDAIIYIKFESNEWITLEASVDFELEESGM